MNRSALALAALLTIPSGAAHPQTKSTDRWQITLASGDYIWDIHLVKLDGDKLLFRQADTAGSVEVAKINELRLIQKSEVRVAEGAAATFGALTGADDEVYDMQAMDFAAKLRTIQQVF